MYIPPELVSADPDLTAVQLLKQLDDNINKTVSQLMKLSHISYGKTPSDLEHLVSNRLKDAFKKVGKSAKKVA